MAFTAAQRVLIRTYTGRPASPRRDRFSTSVYGEIESSMDECGAVPEAQAACEAALARIAAIEVEIAGAQGFAVMAKAEEVTLDPTRDDRLRGNLMREAQLLCSLLGVRMFRSPISRGPMGGPLPMG